MDMVMLAVELHQSRAEAVAYLDHGVFAAAQGLAREHLPPVFGRED
jgi:hypothetical protein